MKIADIKNIEDCFDGSYIRELLFDQVLEKPFIEYLGRLGHLNYFDSFARPFFKIVVPNTAQIKGVQGNQTTRILLQDGNALQWLVQLQQYVNTFDQ